MTKKDPVCTDLKPTELDDHHDDAVVDHLDIPDVGISSVGYKNDVVNKVGTQKAAGTLSSKEQKDLTDNPTVKLTIARIPDIIEFRSSDKILVFNKVEYCSNRKAPCFEDS